MINFRHSGFVSDIIYSLPAIREACNMNNDSANLLLRTGVDNPQKDKPGYQHNPFLLIKEEVDMLRPLLESQDYIQGVEVYDGDATKVNVDLDLFRKQPLNYGAGSIPRYYFSMMGISTNLEQPWLTVKDTDKSEDMVIVSRSLVHHNNSVDWSVLNNYSKETFVFLGGDVEYQELKKKVPSLIHHKSKNYLETAELIQGSKLFIGNQCNEFSIAEGLKKKRMLEVCNYLPNVLPSGGENYDIHYTQLLEFLLDKHLEK